MGLQVQIAEADNTTQYWPNLGYQQSANVIGPVSPFASVKCWADDSGLYQLFKFTDFQPKLGPILALYQADCHFYYDIQFRKLKSQSPAHGRHITIFTINLRHIFTDAGQVLGRIYHFFRKKILYDMTVSCFWN